MTAPVAVDIRTATPADYDPIIAVVDDWWGRCMAPALPRLFLDHFHRTSLVAEKADELVGFLVGFMSPARLAEAYVHFIGVAPRLRRSGLGRQLYKGFFALASSDGRSVVRAVTSSANEGSIAFHRRLGFSVAEIADYDTEGSPKVVFKRGL